MSELSLHLDAARNAIADCGVDQAEIDGIAGVGRYPTLVAQQLGLHPTYVDGTSVGGCSFLVHVRHATAAIAHGLASMVLITHGESGRSRVGVGGFGGPAGTLAAQFQMPYGVTGAPTMFPIGVVRYMKELGLTHEQLASVAVVQRQWAAMNPRAMMRELDHRRRRAGLAARRLSHAPARVLSGDRRWRRVARHLGRTRHATWTSGTRPCTSPGPVRRSAPR